MSSMTQWTNGLISSNDSRQLCYVNQLRLSYFHLTKQTRVSHVNEICSFLFLKVRGVFLETMETIKHFLSTKQMISLSKIMFIFYLFTYTNRFTYSVDVYSFLSNCITVFVFTASFLINYLSASST